MHHVKKILRDMRDNDRYYQEHFEIIKQMPFVKDLINENNKLRETLKTIHKEDKPKTSNVYLEISPEESGNTTEDDVSTDEYSDSTQIKRVEIRNTSDVLSDADMDTKNEKVDIIKEVEYVDIEDDEEELEEEEIEEYTDTELCRNEDCVAEKTDEYDEKCGICPGYYKDDGLNDILFIEEEPNNGTGSCDLCKSTDDVVQMKSTGQYMVKKVAMKKVIMKKKQKKKTVMMNVI